MLRKVFYTVFILAVLAVLVVYTVKNRDHLQGLLVLSAGEIAGYLLLTVMSIYIRGLINMQVYNSIGASLSPAEGTGLAAINTLGNLLPLSTGLVMKGAWLRDRYAVSITRYVSVTTALLFVFISVNGAIGFLVSIAGQIAAQPSFPWWLLLCFLAMTLSAGVLFIPVKSDRQFSSRVMKKLVQLHRGWGIFASDRGLLVKVVLLQGAGVILFAGRLLLLLRMVSQQANLFHTVVFASGSILTQMVNIVPGGMGVREGIIAGLGSLAGFDFGVCAVAVGADRLLLALCSAVFALLMIKGLIKAKS